MFRTRGFIFRKTVIYIYRYGIVCFTCISISSLVGGRVCSPVYSNVCSHVLDYRKRSSTCNTAYTDECKTHYTIPVYTTVSVKMNHRFRNM